MNPRPGLLRGRPGWVGDLPWPLLIMMTVFIASGRSNLATPPTGFPLDKVAHFGVFAALGTSWIRLAPLKSRGAAGAVWAWLLVAVYGASDEWRQSFTPGRVMEWGDWIADVLGALVGVALYQACPAWKHFLETPVGPGRGKPRRARCDNPLATGR